MPLNPSWIRHTHRGNAFKQGWPINNNRKKSRVLLSKSNRSHKIYIWWSVALDALCWISDHKVTKNTKQNIWSVLEWPKGILWRQSIDFGFRDLCPEIDAIPSQIKAWENRACEKELNFENSKLLLTRQKPDHCKDLSVRSHTHWGRTQISFQHCFIENILVTHWKCVFFSRVWVFIKLLQVVLFCSYILTGHVVSTSCWLILITLIYTSVLYYPTVENSVCSRIWIINEHVTAQKYNLWRHILITTKNTKPRTNNCVLCYMWKIEICCTLPTPDTIHHHHHELPLIILPLLYDGLSL